MHPSQLHCKSANRSVDELGTYGMCEAGYRSVSQSVRSLTPVDEATHRLKLPNWLFGCLFETDPKKAKRPARTPTNQPVGHSTPLSLKRSFHLPWIGRSLGPPVMQPACTRGRHHTTPGKQRVLKTSSRPVQRKRPHRTRQLEKGALTTKPSVPTSLRVSRQVLRRWRDIRLCVYVIDHASSYTLLRTDLPVSAGFSLPPPCPPPSLSAPTSVPKHVVN
uniref:Uncharacterized protein n=1 Tax=Vitrella brassicaformis TaxID=1169539 RepID=A0A7S1JSE3_9ALVE|mmetsp:Transcript_19741/g.56635  ORF Transcript_19741/g.56635 Transcript_19741/m.56635 type:complete len:219 (+) Transcript_19741:1501-2157(+)